MLQNILVYNDLFRHILTFVTAEESLFQILCSSKLSRKILGRSFGFWSDAARRKPYECSQAVIDQSMVSDSVEENCRSLRLKMVMLSRVMAKIARSSDVIFIVSCLDAFDYSKGALICVMKRLGTLVSHSESLRFKSHVLQTHVRIAQVARDRWLEPDGRQNWELQEAGVHALFSLSRNFTFIRISPSIFANCSSEIYIGVIMRAIQSVHWGVSMRAAMTLSSCHNYPVLYVKFMAAGVVEQLLTLCERLLMQMRAGSPGSPSAGHVDAAKREASALPPWKEVCQEIANCTGLYVSLSSGRHSDSQLRRYTQLCAEFLQNDDCSGSSALKVLLNHLARLASSDEAFFRDEGAQHIRELKTSLQIHLSATSREGQSTDFGVSDSDIFILCKVLNISYL